MRRRFLGVAIAVGVLLLDPITDGRYRPFDFGVARLDRLSASSPEPDAPPFRSSPEGSSDDIPLSGDGRHLIVTGTLNGVITGPILIDTGASYCVVTHETAKKLGVTPHHSGRTTSIATANGHVEAELVEMDAVQIGNMLRTGVAAVVMDAVEPPLIGIIGMNFLTRSRFSVDLSLGTLRLEP